MSRDGHRCNRFRDRKARSWQQIAKPLPRVQPTPPVTSAKPTRQSRVDSGSPLPARRRRKGVLGLALHPADAASRSCPYGDGRPRPMYRQESLRRPPPRNWSQLWFATPKASQTPRGLPLNQSPKSLAHQGGLFLQPRVRGSFFHQRIIQRNRSPHRMRLKIGMHQFYHQTMSKIVPNTSNSSDPPLQAQSSESAP